MRGGYGIFYNQTTTLNGFYTLATNAPFRDPQTFQATTASPIVLDSNPFPSSLTANSSTANGVNVFPDRLRTAVELRCRAPFWPDLPTGHRLPRCEGNGPPALQHPNQPLSGKGNAGRPYQNFGNITYYIDGGNSDFNALMVKLDKRFK